MQRLLPFLCVLFCSLLGIKSGYVWAHIPPDDHVHHRHHHLHHHEHDHERGLALSYKNLDRLRMDALFHHENYRHLVASNCTELCKQCIEIPVYFHLSGYPLDDDQDTKNGTWVLPHPRSEFRSLQEELAIVSGTGSHALPFIEDGRFSSVSDIYKLIQNNMDVLNRRYVDTPFVFRWLNTDPSQAKVAVARKNAFMFVGNIYKSNDYASATHVGDSRTLNVYLIYRICGHEFIWVDSNCDTIGAATNPSYQLDRTADGVYLAYDTLAGGGFEGYDEGIGLVHEIGHWLGLYHVFESEKSSSSSSSFDEEEDPCDPINALKGDYVDDTAFIPKPSLLMYDCPMTFYSDTEIPNSCPNLPGVDPVFNYMNYVGSESCLPEGVGRFSCGQIERMYKQWLLYRDQYEVCAQNEMKIEITMEMDDDYESLNLEVAPVNGEAVFSWDREMNILVMNDGQEYRNYSREFNFCVPSDREYVLAVTDALRSGFEKGFISLYVDGNLVQYIDGDFGSTHCTRFGSNGMVSNLDSPLADFGSRYRYEAPPDSTALDCTVSNQGFLVEPVFIEANRWMRVNVTLQHFNVGVCINNVSDVDITIDGTTYRVYPGNPEVDSFLRFESRIVSCRDSFCIVEFDLARLEGVYNSKNKDGRYDSVCRANVKLGFGEACDNFFAAKKIDCVSEGEEVFRSAEGNIQFAMSAAVSRYACGIASWLLLTWTTFRS